MMEFHKSRPGHHRLKPVQEVEQFGIVVVDDAQRIRRFQEKPRAEEGLQPSGQYRHLYLRPRFFQISSPASFMISENSCSLPGKNQSAVFRDAR